jgi:hypothetical protein
MKQLMVSIDANLSQQKNFVRSRTVPRRVTLLTTLQTNPRRLKTTVAAGVNRNVVGHSFYLNLLLAQTLRLSKSHWFALLGQKQGCALYGSVQSNPCAK